jgi:hypothetical protein
VPAAVLNGVRSEPNHLLCARRCTERRVCASVLLQHNLSRWDVDELYARLRGYLDRGDILSAGTHGSDERMAEGLVALGLSTDVVGEGTAGESVSSCGVVAGHAYSLLGVAEYEGTKLAQLRNPW